MSDWIKWETFVEAPKAMGFKPFLYELNAKYGATLSILDHDKGLLRETIRFKFSGERSVVTALREEYIKVVTEALHNHPNGQSGHAGANPVSSPRHDASSSRDNANENAEPQESGAHFLGNLCQVMGGQIQYAPNQVSIEAWTRHEGQRDALYALANRIKTHFNIDYAISCDSESVTIKVNGGDEKLQRFANAFCDRLDWKIEPEIINEPRVNKNPKL